MERDTQAREPETAAAEPPAMAEEMTDEQLDQVAGGAIVIEVPRYSGGISTDL
jgi:hypothetical protein